MEKIGRNELCPCGSGKKYKQCCLKKSTGKRKLTAKWINAPAGPNLIERSYGNAIAETGKTFTALEEKQEKKKKELSEKDQENK